MTVVTIKLDLAYKTQAFVSINGKVDLLYKMHEYGHG